MEKISEKIYRKETPVTHLVDEIQKAAEEKGLRLSRWQANKGNHATEITYAVHAGERAAQFRLQQDVIDWVALNQNEGTTERCEAYRKLATLKF